MRCPGTNSIFSHFELDFTPEVEALEYKAETDTRFRLIKINLGHGLGSLGAFYRPPLIQQPHMTELRSMVAEGSFKGQRALIVGGSRGLGELTAKLVALGGGKTVVTYYQGREDALHLQGEIREAGGDCELLQWCPSPVDATSQPGSSLTCEGITHLYYYASPRIFVQKSEMFVPEVFQRFYQVYVEGLLQALAALAGQKIAVFYPSTVFLDEPEWSFAEYAAAKAAGESLCRHHDRFHPTARFLVRRLPRLATDQTTALFGEPPAPPEPTILSIVQEMHDLRRS
jgi:hypothetical protein